MWTVSWQPGALKGYSVVETQQIIIRGLQMWSAVSRVRFGVVPHGSPAHITFYPYSGNMNGAFMATYMATRQVLYSTQIHAPRHFCTMAIAHEVGHCFGLLHTNRPESLMFTRGSEVMYFDAIEGRAAWNRFGKFTGSHWPWSLQFVGDQIRSHQAEYNSADTNWKKFRDLRDRETDVPKRRQLNTLTLEWLAKRHQVHTKLAAADARWWRIRREWEAIGGIRQGIAALEMEVPPVEHTHTPDEICECFKPENVEFYGGALTEPVDLRGVFQSLPKTGVPLNL